MINHVSIPQAVGTVATIHPGDKIAVPIYKFQYRKRQVLLQPTCWRILPCTHTFWFQYRKRQVLLQLVKEVFCFTQCLYQFQYRKRQVLLQLLNKLDVETRKSAGFNTASGRYCCNYYRQLRYRRFQNQVSIPQAVGTVATQNGEQDLSTSPCFNTASGRYCCNFKELVYAVRSLWFQYRKRQVLLQH